ncbi:P-loop containing nucleoside triphosphate hydrolase protein [Lyophyllum atratum]|nr:P-loop containing nucleoside triphosphate hydrolase protein [Lyophyllum atratum]
MAPDRQIFTPWQLNIFEKAAEGLDTFAIAGTGSGKSLVFVLLALAAEMAESNGLVIVISPLKSLQKDQVLRFNLHEGRAPFHYKDRGLKLAAVAINEDNHEDAVFTQLAQGLFRLCYASPECLLHNTQFKKLFRREKFRNRIITMVVDEAHVIEAWKDEFRKDYNELNTLRVIAGSEIPWMALTATCSTRTFEIIFNSLGLGGARSFWGIDLGSDRPNLAQWVRPMEHSMASMADLLVFIPQAPDGPESFEKSIFYFRTRQQTRRALKLCRRLVPEQFKNLFRANAVRIIFATLALGMGLDIPDVTQVVIYGVDGFNDAFQKGGRGGRARNINAKMIWIVEPWAFYPVETPWILHPESTSTAPNRTSACDNLRVITSALSRTSQVSRGTRPMTLTQRTKVMMKRT